MAAKTILCTTCKKKVTPRSAPGLSCAGCQKADHFSCLQITAEKKDRYLSGADNYLCPQCKSKHRVSLSFVATPPQQKSTSATSTGQGKNSERAVPPKIDSQLNEPLLSTLIALVSTLQKTVDSLEKRLLETLEQIAFLKADRSDLKSQRKSGKVQPDPNGKKSYTINGVTLTENENVKEIASSVLKYFDNTFEADDSIEVKRLPSKTASSTPTILVTLPLTATPSITILKKANRRCVVGKDIGLATSEKIFINEAHSQGTYNLYKKARALKAKGFRFVWIQADRVLVKKEDGAKIVQLKNLSHLEELLSSLPDPNDT